MADSIASNHQESHASVDAPAGLVHERLQGCLRVQEPEGHLRLLLPPHPTSIPPLQRDF